jgi:hypothetical protein
LHACHLRCKEGGTLFLASALSPNRDIVIIAAGIGVMEDAEHWEWFTKHLREGTGIQEFEDTVVMSDREKGLDSALRDVLGEVPHSYCSFHLKKNVVNTIKTDLKGKIHTLAKALTPYELSAVMEECEELSPGAAQYLKGPCFLFLPCIRCVPHGLSVSNSPFLTCSHSIPCRHWQP